MNAHERAYARLFEALTACCLVACLLASAQGAALWAVVLAAGAFGCYEASA